MKISQKHEKFIRVLIVAEGDEWAGIESHLSNLLIEIKRKKNIDMTVLLFHTKDFYNWLIENNIRVKAIKKKNILNTFAIIIKFLFKHKFHVIHTHSTSAGFYFSIPLVFFKKQKWINTQHSKPEKVRGSGLVKSRMAANIVYVSLRLKKNAKVICVTKDIANWINEKKRVQTYKITTIYNGISFYNMQKKDQEINRLFSLPKDIYKVAVVGRLEHVKGHKYLIEALRLLKEQDHESIKNVNLYIVGEGSEKKQILKLINRYHLGKYIFLVGYIKNAYNFVKLCDAVIIPSIHEGIPYTLLEAMVLEKTIIASYVGGMKEILIDKINCLAVPPKDSFALKSAIILAIRNHKLNEKLRVNARRLVENTLSSSRMAKHTIEEYYK